VSVRWRRRVEPARRVNPLAETRPRARSTPSSGKVRISRLRAPSALLASWTGVSWNALTPRRG